MATSKSAGRANFGTKSKEKLEEKPKTHTHTHTHKTRIPGKPRKSSEPRADSAVPYEKKRDKRRCHAMPDSVFVTAGITMELDDRIRFINAN